MKVPFLEGKKLYLRALKRSDLNEEYLQWLNDQEVTRFMESGYFPSTPEKIESFFKETRDPKYATYAIVDKKTDKHIGNIKLGPINWYARTSNFGIMIGNKKFWNKGYGTEATTLVLAHAFNRLNLHKVNLGVVDLSKDAIKIYKKLGFKIEGRARENFYLDGKYRDCFYMGILGREFREKHKK